MAESRRSLTPVRQCVSWWLCVTAPRLDFRLFVQVQDLWCLRASILMCLLAFSFSLFISGFLAAGLDNAMDLLEQKKHGVNHPLSGMVVLEKICQYTKADKSDPALNNALLTWVVHDLDCAI